MQPSDVADELDLRHYIEVLKRRRLIVVAAVTVVVAVAMGLTLRQTPQYRASAEVLLRSSTSEQLLGSGSENNNATQQRRTVDTEIEYMLSRSVRDAVEEKLGFAPSVSVRPNGDTDVVTVRATNTDADLAAEVATVYAQTYIDVRREELINELLRTQETLQTSIDDLEAELAIVQADLAYYDEALTIEDDPETRQILLEERNRIEEEIGPERDLLQAQLSNARLQLRQYGLAQQITQTGGAQLISQARVPASPFAPTPIRNAVVAIVIGLIFGVGLAFLFETLDDRVRSKQDLERVTGWSVVGLIPLVANWRDAKRARLISLEEPNSPAAEAYRTLRTSVQFLGLERPLQVIQVTSANAADGKSTTMSNLGVALARAGNRVIIVDCDLRRPRLGDFFGVEQDTGLTSVLLGEAKLQDAIVPVAVERRLSILPSGPPPPNPSELLALRRTAEVFDELRKECDIVLVDAPPVLPVTDAVVLAGMVDGVIVVVNATKTRQREIQRASELLAQVNAPVIGSVVNGVDNERGYGYYYGYSYGYGDAPLKADRRTEDLVDEDRDARFREPTDAGV